MTYSASQYCDDPACTCGHSYPGVWTAQDVESIGDAYRSLYTYSYGGGEIERSDGLTYVFERGESGQMRLVGQTRA